MKSVIICLLHVSRLACTKKCISNLLNTKGVNFSILLLIQGPQSEKTEEYLKEVEKKESVEVFRSIKIKLCWEGRKYLFTKILEPYPDYVLTLDNDIYVPKEWFMEMEKTFLNAPKNTMGVSMTLNHGGKILGGFDYGIDEITRVLKYNPVEAPHKMDLVCSGCFEGTLMFPYKNIHLIQVDPTLTPYAGHDLLLTIQKLGYKFIICSNFVAMHKSNPSRDYTATRFKGSMPHSYERFCRKWGLNINKFQYLRIILGMKHPGIWSILYRLRPKMKNFFFESQSSLWLSIRYVLNTIRGIFIVLFEGKALTYFKWILRYAMKGNWSLGTEMAYWDDELNNKRPEGWIEPIHSDIEPTIYRLKEVFGKNIDVLELGPGPRSRLTEGYRKKWFNLVAIDPLAEDFRKYLNGESFLRHGFGESVDEMFKPESFHLTYASNVLDHSQNAIKCFQNMVLLTKIGGFIMVQGNINEGDRTNWLGIHKYNLWINDDKLMCSTRFGIPIDLSENMPLKKIDSRQTLLEGNPWFSITYERDLN